MGYILALLFLALFINTINLPRTALDQRATLRLFHDSLGLIVLLLAAVRVYLALHAIPRHNHRRGCRRVPLPSTGPSWCSCT
jgi:cytochrome b561